MAGAASIPRVRFLWKKWLDMPRVATSDAHANLAVDMFRALLQKNDWGLNKAWLAITQLLVTCDVWEAGAWREFYGLPQEIPDRGMNSRYLFHPPLILATPAWPGSDPNPALRASLTRQR